MRDDDFSPDLLLQRLVQRDMDMCVLAQRAGLLLDAGRTTCPGKITFPSGSSINAEEDAKSTAGSTRTNSSGGMAQGNLDISSTAAREGETRRLMKKCLARISGERKAEIILSEAMLPEVAVASQHQPQAPVTDLLSPPSFAETPCGHQLSLSAPRGPIKFSADDSGSARNVMQGVNKESEEACATNVVTYREFLEHLKRTESQGFVRAIRLFLFSVLGNGGDVDPVSARPRAETNGSATWDTDDVEVYGSSFLVQRCAEFFLAMQNAMGVHPSWAELGYDSIVACREHLERLVMTKIHPLAFWGKLDGAVDASISARFRALQFLTPRHLNVHEHAADDTVLALAQAELRKMNSGRCPGDMIARVVRCCDIIFALLDQNRRRRSRRGRESDSPWKQELHPSGTADDFLPVLIYVVLRANVPRLHSMCEYVQAFHSPVALMSRSGYCFVALRSAIEFLMTLDGAAVGMPEVEFRRLILATIGGASGTSARIPV